MAREIRPASPPRAAIPLPYGQSAAAGFLQGLGIEPARQGAAAGQASFFVGKDNDFQRVSGPESRLIQHLDALDGRHHSQHPVVGPGQRHGIDVGPQHNGGAPGRESLPAPRQVAGIVDTDFQAGLPHQPGHILPAAEIGLGESQAGDSLRGSSDAGQPVDVFLKAFRIDPEGRRLCGFGPVQRPCEQQQAEGQAAELG